MREADMRDHDRHQQEAAEPQPVAEDMPGMVIRFVSLDETRTVTVGYTETTMDFTVNQYHRSSGALAHDDLVDAWHKLKPHLAHACELVEAVGLDITHHDSGRLEHVAVQSVVIKGEIGSSEHEVKLAGTKEVRGKTMALKAPGVLLFSSADPYAFKDDLAHVLEVLDAECREYMNGKVKEKQLALDIE